MSNRFPLNNLGDTIAAQPIEKNAAYVDDGTGIATSFTELDQAASRLGGGFSKHLNRGDRIAILARNGLNYTLTYLAAMRVGLVPVPLNYKLPKQTIAHILADASCSMVLGDAEFKSLLPKANPLTAFESAEFESLMSSAPTQIVRPQPGDLCEVLYTSGSTGLPKGVPLDHMGQVWALEVFLNTLSETPERTIIAAPTYHMNGLFFTTVALAAGWHTISMPSFDPRRYLELVAEEQITLVSGIPTMFAMMARETDLIERLDLGCVRSVVIGSAPLTLSLIARVRSLFPKAELRNSYGTTESGPAMFGPHPNGLERPELAIGYPYDGVEWKLVGGTENEGRLLTRTPAVLKGYLNLPEVSAQKLDDGWYDTGDIVRRDKNGWFFFVGREDDMFVCGGENVYPGEVEHLLEKRDEVLQAAVVAVPDAIKGMIPIAFVSAAPGREIEPDAIKAFTLENGPAYAHPRAVVPMDTLPVGGTHKIDKKALKNFAIAAAAKLNRES